MVRRSLALTLAVLLLTAAPAMAAAESAQDESQFSGVILALVFGLLVGAYAFLHSETRGRSLVREEDEPATHGNTGEHG